MRKEKQETDIICTIGPSSNSLKVLEEMFLNGMTIVRINASHGTIETHQDVINKIKFIEKKYNEKIYIALDTKGPETRIHCEKLIEVRKNDIIEIYDLKNYELIKNKAIAIATDMPSLNSLEIGDEIIADDTKLILKVLKIEKDKIVVLATNNHIIKPNKRIKFPDRCRKREFLSENDKKDINFAIENKLDALFLSFIEDSDDIIQVKNFISDSKMLLIPKIESQKAVNNLEKIVKYSQGIMIARGDLMNDIGIDKLFSTQKHISRISSFIPVIMATEMLQSMTESETPYRAEISDIGNAIMDGCAAVMLSSKSAIGKHPAHCVDVLRRVCINSEQYFENNKGNKRIFLFENDNKK